jgi:hypothetical protein
MDQTAMLTLTPSNGLTPLSSPSELRGATGGMMPPPLALDGGSATTATNQHHFSNGSSDTQEEHNTLSVHNAIRNLTTKVIHEVREAQDTGLAKIGGIQLLRRAFKEFYTRESVHVFKFLDAPISANSTVTKSIQIMRRFGRPEVQMNRIKIRDLLLDMSCNTVIPALQDTFPVYPQQDLHTWVAQTRWVMEQWRQAATDFASAEKQLSTAVTVFQELDKKCKALITLPETPGALEEYSVLVEATERYILRAFQDNQIDVYYNSWLIALKKLSVLSDSITAIRAIVNSPTEPMCGVCFNEPVASACVPCGHTFCSTCSMRQSVHCYICRVPIKEKLRIYLS